MSPLSCEASVWWHNTHCSLAVLHWCWRMENRHLHLATKFYRPREHMPNRHALKHLRAIKTSPVVESGLFVLTFLCFCSAASNIWDIAARCFQSSGGTLFGLLHRLIWSRHCCLSASPFTWLMTFCTWLGKHVQLFRVLSHWGFFGLTLLIFVTVYEKTGEKKNTLSRPHMSLAHLKKICAYQ